jgi:hypothetical protein
MLPSSDLCTVESLPLDCLVWFSYRNLSHIYIGDVAHNVSPYLPTLANRNDPISVATPKVAKASTIVAAMCHCSHCYRLKYNANVNYPLEWNRGHCNLRQNIAFI